MRESEALPEVQAKAAGCAAGGRCATLCCKCGLSLERQGERGRRNHHADRECRSRSYVQIRGLIGPNYVLRFFFAVEGCWVGLQERRRARAAPRAHKALCAACCLGLPRRALIRCASRGCV